MSCHRLSNVVQHSTKLRQADSFARRLKTTKIIAKVCIFAIAAVRDSALSQPGKQW
jgi:hypothetical protein